MSDEELGDALKGSAMSRARRTGMRRNVDLSVANSRR
jgi:hypothetical protein